MITKSPMLFLAGWAMMALSACRVSSPPPVDFGSYEIAEKRFVKPPEADSRPWLDRLLLQAEFSLEDFLMVVDRFHPQLEVERRSIDLAVAEAWEAQLYPNPSAFAGIEEWGSSGLTNSKRMLGVAVPIVIGGRIDAARTLVDKERELAALTYIWRRREILSAAKQAFVRHLAAKQEASLALTTRDIARTLHDVTNERFKAQAIPEMEVLKAAVNLAAAEADVRSLESHLAISVKHLQAFMGNVDFPKDRFSGELTVRFAVPSLAALRGQVTGTHPLTEASLKAREVAELKVSHARGLATPDLSVQFAVGADSEGDTILDVGVEIPFPLYNRNQAGIAAAEIRLRQAESQVQSVRTDLLLRLMESYRTFVSAQDRVKVYQEEILPKAQKALDQTNEGYRLGKFGYLDVLDAQRTLADSTKALTASLADLNLAASDLETLTGTRLETAR